MCLEVNHRFVDGWHLGQFYQHLQQAIDLPTALFQRNEIGIHRATVDALVLAGQLAAFGEVRTPSIPDLFVAVMQDGAAPLRPASATGAAA